MFKKIVSFLTAAVLTVSLVAGAAGAAYDGNVDYMAIMIEAAKTGDYARGNAAEAARNEKIDAEGLNAQKISFTDLYLLAKVIYIEAGSARLSDEWKLAVGEVLLNRVASPEFPNTVYDVVYQPGQYASAGTSAWAGMMPNEHCIRLALRLLHGERHMEPSVVFQANFRQGSGVYRAMYDNWFGWTYFCYSSYPALYVNLTPDTEEEKAETEDNIPEESPEISETPDEEATDSEATDSEVAAPSSPLSAHKVYLNYVSRNKTAAED